MARREPYPRLQPFVSVPGDVAVINCVVAGAIFGIIGLGLDLGTGGSIALGCGGFGLAFVFCGVWASRWIARSARELVVRFPTPGDDGVV